MRRAKRGDSGYPGEIMIEEKPSIAGKIFRVLGFIAGFLLVKIALTSMH